MTSGSFCLISERMVVVPFGDEEEWRRSELGKGEVKNFAGLVESELRHL